MINYELPQEAANYVHRIGRTGRAGKSGRAISLCAHEDCENLDAIYELIGSKIPKIDLKDEDFATDITARPYIDSKTLKVVERNNKGNSREKTRARSPKEKEGRQQMSEQNTEQNHGPAEKKPLTEFLPFVPSASSGPDSREFVYTTTSTKDLEKSALGYFRINDPELLDIKVLKTGMPKFFFFGPRKTTYSVQLKAIYKKLLLPFIIEIIKIARLRLFARVSFKNNNIRVSFDGPDEGLLLRNHKELLRSFEYLIKTYMLRKIRLPKDVRLEVISVNERNSRSDNKMRNPQRNQRDNRNKLNGDRRRRYEMSEEEIIAMAEEMKNKLLETKEPVSFKPLNSGQRRIVHQYFSDYENISTNSIGEGRLKKIEIELRS